MQVGLWPCAAGRTTHSQPAPAVPGFCGPSPWMEPGPSASRCHEVSKSYHSSCVWFATADLCADARLWHTRDRERSLPGTRSLFEVNTVDVDLLACVPQASDGGHLCQPASIVVRGNSICNTAGSEPSQRHGSSNSWAGAGYHCAAQAFLGPVQLRCRICQVLRHQPSINNCRRVAGSIQACLATSCEARESW